jgi:hypothetical protein
MPGEAAPCVLDEGTQTSLLEIIDALAAESPSVEIDGDEVDLKALRSHIASCLTEMPKFKVKRKRGPRVPSRYNQFISECRRSTDKGGRGLDFSQCVAEWNKQKK